MTKSIYIIANDNIQWRLLGSSSWHTLVGGNLHKLDFSGGEEIELLSYKEITHIKIYGDIKDININRSKINTLEDSFSNTRFLENVSITNNYNILNMDKTFKNSGILTFTIDTSNVLSYKEAFKYTDRVEDINISVASTYDITDSFRGSNVKNINSLVPFNPRIFDNYLAYTKNLSNISELHFQYSENEKLLLDDIKNSKIIQDFDIKYSRNKILEKKTHILDTNNIKDDNYLFEMLFKHNEIISQAIRTPIEEPLQDNISTEQDLVNIKFEADYKHNSPIIPTSLRTQVDIDSLENSSDLGIYNIEIDTKQQNIIQTNIRTDNTNTVVDNLPISTNVDLVNYLFEYDAKQQNLLNSSTRIPIDNLSLMNNLNLNLNKDLVNYRYEADMKHLNILNDYKLDENYNSINNLETNIDANYNFEIDLVAESSISLENNYNAIEEFDKTVDSNYRFELDLVSDYVYV